MSQIDTNSQMEFDQVLADYVFGFDKMILAMEEAQTALDEYVSLIRWIRFDSITGPLIGACVICGIILIAAIGAWLA